jgi:hypothetical protein
MPSSFSSTVAAISERAKQHHSSVQGAYEAFYGVGSRSSSFAATPNSRSARGSVVSAAPSADKKASAWDKVKKAAKDHHRAANEAYQAYYGIGMSQNQS